jgi:endonuclease/exonuclease/phosphatase (EEP) superfamily protein YafD
MTRARLGHALVVCFWVACWCAIAGLAVVALWRIVAYDRSRFVTLFAANTFWLYLPAYPIVFVALFFRKWWLASAGLVIVALHMAWVLPTFTHRLEISDAARRAPHVRIVSANVRFDNQSRPALARELMSYDADVLVLQEITPTWWETLRAEGVLRAYPYHAEALYRSAGGAAIVSKRPLFGERVVEVAGWPLVSVDVSTEGGVVRLVDVHSVPPAFDYPLSQQMLHGITDHLMERLADGVPTIVAGDFNATPYNRWVHTVQGLGLSSAHEAVGRPLATTWPNGLHKFPPLRIDHVFFTGTLVPLRVREGNGTGSDHRPVITDIAILG